MVSKHVSKLRKKTRTCISTDARSPDKHEAKRALDGLYSHVPRATQRSVSGLLWLFRVFEAQQVPSCKFLPLQFQFLSGQRSVDLDVLLSPEDVEDGEVRVRRQR